MKRGFLAYRRWSKASCLAVLLALLVHGFSPPLRGEEFQKVKLLVVGMEKTQELEVILSLEEDRMVVRSKESLSDLKALPYKEIKVAEYSYSKSPRWKSAGAAAVAVGIFAVPIFFMKGKKHWLTVRTQDDYAVLNLDKKNYRLILPAFETRSGVKVDMLADEK